ncbi:hypothetical protein MGWOODY_Tha235 [hydrothermal vent metagenome]|uniref:Uncharacterized protein n=1 Tax=hydrothermal vent metagenome TaxID=652676 RepID=A0A160TD89_9ZZZZ
MSPVVNKLEVSKDCNVIIYKIDFKVSEILLCNQSLNTAIPKLKEE